MAEVKTRQIKAWMVLNGYTQKSLAKLYGSHLCLIGRFVNGQRTSEPLKQFLIELGCKAEWFGAPKKRMGRRGA